MPFYNNGECYCKIRSPNIYTKWYKKQMTNKLVNWKLQLKEGRTPYGYSVSGKRRTNVLSLDFDFFFENQWTNWSWIFKTWGITIVLPSFRIMKFARFVFISSGHWRAIRLFISLTDSLSRSSIRSIRICSGAVTTITASNNLSLPVSNKIAAS